MHTRPIIRHVARTVAIATAAATLVAGASGAQPVEAADALPADTLAQYVGFNRTDRFNAIESALGRPLDRVVLMADHKAPSNMRSAVWGNFVKQDAYLPKLSDRLDVTLTVPLAFGENKMYQRYGPQAVARNLTKTTSGAYDADYRTVAKNLIAAGYGDAVLRLGHEFDGTFYPWSARDNEQAYVEAFRHVQRLFERESPAFRFEWTGMNATWRAHAPNAYPGDAYVDIIGLDIYYRSSGAISDRDWNRYRTTLEAHRDFAIARGKPVSYPEWGRAFGDTTRFIDLMHGWFSSLPASGPGSLEYQSYFNSPGQGGHYNLDNQPNVKRRYLQLFRTTPTSPSPVPPTQPAPQLTITTAPVPAPPPAAPPAPTSTAPSPSAPSISLAPGSQSLRLTWAYPDAERKNVRYRVAGTTEWRWVLDGSFDQVIGGLRASTTYEVQARGYVGGRWQPWIAATATTR